MGCLVPYVQVVSPTISADAGEVGGLSASAYSQEGTLDVYAEKVGYILASVSDCSASLNVDVVDKGIGLTVVVYLSCAINVSAPYLEISPSLIWIFDWPAENDVYSNVYWEVN